MPAVSQQQRRYLYARFGAQWAKKHHMDNEGKLPARVSGGKAITVRTRKKRVLAALKGGSK